MEDRMTTQSREISELKSQVKEQNREIIRFRSEYEKVKTVFDPLMGEIYELQNKMGDTDQRFNGWIEQVRNALQAWMTSLRDADRRINILNAEVRDMKTQRIPSPFQMPRR
jgi:uncharacterized coiled-coil DUF342 family protein